MEQEYEKQKISFTYIVFLPTVLATEVVLSISMEVSTWDQNVDFIHLCNIYWLSTKNQTLHTESTAKKKTEPSCNFGIYNIVRRSRQ